jgi:hypothetical protein
VRKALFLLALIGIAFATAFSSNDWLATALHVTEPSTALLLGLGLVVIAACAIRLRIARGL